MFSLQIKVILRKLLRFAFGCFLEKITKSLVSRKWSNIITWIEWIADSNDWNLPKSGRQQGLALLYELRHVPNTRLHFISISSARRRRWVMYRMYRPSRHRWLRRWSRCGFAYKKKVLGNRRQWRMRTWPSLRFGIRASYLPVRS